jgi:hypothetical protein
MHFVLSKQWGKIDYRVWISLIILAVLSISLFGYRAATLVRCPGFSLLAQSRLNHLGDQSNTFFINEQLTFSVSITAPDSIIAWDFGDKTRQVKGSKVTHVFSREGNYLVTATIKGRCSESINLVIKAAHAALTNENAILPDPIISDDILEIGREATFQTSANSQTYQWSVEDHPEMGKITSPQAKFIFTKAGNFTVLLSLDNSQVYRKVIQVNDPLVNEAHKAALPPAVLDLPPLPAPTPDVPEKKEEPVVKQQVVTPPVKTYDQLPNPAIQAMLEEVAQGKKSASDFDNILCNGSGTKVMANNESTTFASLCEALKHKRGLPLLKKNRRIQSVKVVRDEENGNCVKILYVDYK